MSMTGVQGLSHVCLRILICTACTYVRNPYGPAQVHDEVAVRVLERWVRTHGMNRAW